MSDSTHDALDHGRPIAKAYAGGDAPNARPDHDPQTEELSLDDLEVVAGGAAEAWSDDDEPGEPGAV
jgi:hypothetical protein